jgi:CheY-like chemotaxis protein
MRQPVIIAMTANALPEDCEICLRKGMDDYLSKPIKVEDILLVLKKWWSKTA